MFKNINEYIKLSREERRLHLDLEQQCMEIGGATSVYYKGLLAHHLHTTIPKGNKIYLCHACGNHKCSNPSHLYWGTPKDNHADAVDHGTYKSFHERIIEKYGQDGAIHICQNGGKAKRKGFKKKPPKRISDEKLKQWQDAILTTNTSRYGWIQEISRKMNCSHTNVRRILKHHFPEVQGLKRKLI